MPAQRWKGITSEKSLGNMVLMVFGSPEWTPQEQCPHNTEEWNRSSLSLIPDVTSRWPWGGPSQPDDRIGDDRFPGSRPSTPSRSDGLRAWVSVTSCAHLHPQQCAVIRSRQDMFKVGPRAGWPQLAAAAAEQCRRLNSGRDTLTVWKLKGIMLLTP